MKRYILTFAVCFLMNPIRVTAAIPDKLPILAVKYGVDPFLAASIIYCESKGRPDAVWKNKDKNGEVWSRDWGYWQINDYYQDATATAQGYDIHDPEQNLEYGFVLMSKQGTRPWSASQSCWKKLSTATTSQQVATDL